MYPANVTQALKISLIEYTKKMRHARDDCLSTLHVRKHSQEKKEPRRICSFQYKIIYSKMVLKVGCILKILEWLFGRCWTRLHEQRFLHCTCYPSYIPMHEEIFTCLITLTQYNLDPALLPSSLVQLPLMELPEKATYIKLFLV